MAEIQNFLVCLVVFSAASTCLLAQTTPSLPALSPPNCNCSTSSWQNQNANNSSNSQPPFFPRQHGRHGMKGHNKQICANDNRNYTSMCEFVNAQAMNPGLGMRSCNSMMNNSAANPMQNSSSQPWSRPDMQRPGMGMRPDMGMGPWDRRNHGHGHGGMHGGMMNQQKSFCMTDGTIFNGTMADKQLFMQQNPTVGVRCHGSCPCGPLQCPQSHMSETWLFVLF